METLTEIANAFEKINGGSDVKCMNGGNNLVFTTKHMTVTWNNSFHRVTVNNSKNKKSYEVKELKNVLDSVKKVSGDRFISKKAKGVLNVIERELSESIENNSLSKVEAKVASIKRIAGMWLKKVANNDPLKEIHDIFESECDDLNVKCVYNSAALAFVTDNLEVTWKRSNNRVTIEHLKFWKKQYLTEIKEIANAVSWIANRSSLSRPANAILESMLKEINACVSQESRPES